MATASARARPAALAATDLSAFGIHRDRLVVGQAREFEVLLVLVTCAGHVVSRERIYEHVWERSMPHARDRAVDTHIGRIRVRLAEVSPGWSYIHTHFGHSYRFEPERAIRRRRSP
jgi:DNA-binding response OmpR family regulator